MSNKHLTEVDKIVARAIKNHECGQFIAPRFKETFCSQCGKKFGPGNHGYSHCIDHQHTIKKSTGANNMATLYAKIPDALYEDMKKCAELEQRSLTNWVQVHMALLVASQLKNTE